MFWYLIQKMFRVKLMNPEYLIGISAIGHKVVLSKEIPTIYNCMLEFAFLNRFEGACHATSAILHVLLSEKGVENKLMCGEIGKDNVCFDHSWIEIEGRIYDIAVALPLIQAYASNPIYAGFDIVSMNAPKWEYGFSSGLPDDSGMQIVKRGSFTDYMNGAPYHKNGLWAFVQKLGGQIGLKPSLNKMREKYRDAQWQQKEV